MARSTVLILDFGSQFTQLIARRIREAGVYSTILPGHSSLERVQSESPRAIILSGGPSSVYEERAPRLATGVLEYQKTHGIPLLGICYGMQLLTRDLGGKVSPGKTREYGRMGVKGAGAILPVEKPEFQAWMSHGDECVEAPAGFRVAGRSSDGKIAAMENLSDRRFGLQFHPEVSHTECGSEILKAFLFGQAGLEPDWKMADVIRSEIQKIESQVGPGEHAICGLSGGVDSAVAAVLVHRAIGERQHCIFVDHGMLRYQERERVMTMFRDHLHLNVECVDAAEIFLSALRGVEDPEQKRKIIGRLFIETFEEASDRIASRIGKKPKFLVQGTLYPDVIESSPAPGAAGASHHAQTIKSHHNVGGLPEDMNFTLVEPLRALFKDEVRKLGAELGVDRAFLARHPFPGPGLAVRVLGEVRPERVEILQRADEIFIEMLRSEGLYDAIWQAFAVFLPIRTVGVQGDGRTHDHVIALRAVTSSDGMTADFALIPPSFLGRVATRICNEVRGVSRVVYDVTSKPPATIEWE